MEYEDVGSRTNGVSFTVALESGWNFYVTVRAWNGAGSETTFKGDGFLADFDPPVIGKVVDGWGETDAAYQTSVDTVYVGWRWTEDLDSGIAEFWVGLGSSPFVADLVEPVRVAGNETRAKLAGLSLTASAATLYSILRAVDFAGHETTMGSDGFVLDNTPPVAVAVGADGFVRDGVPDTPELDYITNAAVYTANWDIGVDKESGIATVEFALGMCTRYPSLLRCARLTRRVVDLCCRKCSRQRRRAPVLRHAAEHQHPGVIYLGTGQHRVRERSHHQQGRPVHSVLV